MMSIFITKQEKSFFLLGKKRNEDFKKTVTDIGKNGPRISVIIIKIF